MASFRWCEMIASMPTILLLRIGGSELSSDGCMKSRQTAEQAYSNALCHCFCFVVFACKLTLNRVIKSEDNVAFLSFSMSVVFACHFQHRLITCTISFICLKAELTMYLSTVYFDSYSDISTYDGTIQKRLINSLPK